MAHPTPVTGRAVPRRVPQPPAAGVAVEPWHHNTYISMWDSFTARRNIVRSISEIAEMILSHTDGGTGPGKKSTISPTFATFAGVFTEQRTEGHFQEHSGLIPILYEQLNRRKINPETWKRKAAKSVPSLALAYTSPSNNGVRMMVMVHPKPVSQKEHQAAYEAATSALEAAGLTGWSNTKPDIRSHAYLPGDSRLFLADRPEPLDWKKEQIKEPQCLTDQERKGDSS